MANNNFVSYSDMAVLMGAIGNKFDALAGAYVPKGSVAFSGLPSTLSADNLGFVYDVNEEFTTDSRFAGYVSPGKTYPAGTNVVVIDASATSTPDYKFDVMSGFIDLNDIYSKIAAAVALVAPTFDTATAYAKDDYVIYNGAIYQFTTAHAAGTWTGSDATSVGDVSDVLNYLQTQIDTLGAGKANLEVIANPFSTTSSFQEGSFTIYEGELYKFEAYHSGAWTGTDVHKTNLGFEINYLYGLYDSILPKIAEEFSTLRNYSAGDYVLYDGVLRKFTSDKSAGDWNPMIVTTVVVLDEVKANTDAIATANTNIANLSGSIADAFNPSKSGGYAIGDKVMYQNKLYRFTAAHTGAWDSSDVVEVTTLDLIDEAAGSGGSAEAKIATLSADLADTFSTATNYAVGDYVSYEGKIYKFTSAHNAGAWTGSDVAEVTDIVADAAATKTSFETFKIAIADEFSNQAFYDENDIVYYEGSFYQFNTSHYGQWNSNDVTELTLAEAIAAADDNIQDIKDSIAPEFNSAYSYDPGSYVWHEGALFCLRNGKSAGNWDPITAGSPITICGQLQGIKDDFNNKANSSAIVGEFDIYTNYAVGDRVMYQGRFCEFTQAHNAGAWTYSDNKDITVEELIDGLGTRINVVRSDVAGVFDATANYITGDLVIYGDILYQFTANHAAGAWTGEDVVISNLASVIEALSSRVDTVTNEVAKVSGALADGFSASTAYAIGDVVTYQNELYKFKAAHAAGAWSASDVDKVTVEDLIDANATVTDTAITNIDNSIADGFNAASAYAVGAVVMKDNKLYQFTSAHTAGDPWSSSEVSEVSVAELVDDAEPESLTPEQIAALEALL